MTSMIIRCSFAALLLVCFSFGFLDAGSSSNVTEEDKAAATEASEAKENAEKNAENADAANKGDANDQKGEEEKTQDASQMPPVEEVNRAELYKQELNEESKKVVEDLKALHQDLNDHEDDLQYARNKKAEFFKNHAGPEEEVVGIDNESIKGAEGSPDIPVRIYHSISGESGDLIIFVHGGEWQYGDLDSYDNLCKKMANGLEADIVSVGYRRVEEKDGKHPSALDDLFQVYDHYASNLTYRSIILAGDDVGGNLCAALCIKLHEGNQSLPKAQILMYPILSSNVKSESYTSFGECEALTKKAVSEAFSKYIPEDATEPENNKLIYPMLEKDMTVFPKTIIISAGYDVALDDALDFAKNLRAAKKPVFHIIDNGVVHNYMSYASNYNDLIAGNFQKVRAFLNGKNPDAINGDGTENAAAEATTTATDSNSEGKTKAAEENASPSTDGNSEKLSSDVAEKNGAESAETAAEPSSEAEKEEKSESASDDGNEEAESDESAADDAGEENEDE